MPAPSQTKLRPVTVPNPFFSRAHPVDASNPRTIPAVVNIRESAITTLAARGALDAAQIKAANHFRKLWEAMAGKGASGFDPGRIVVDGGEMPDGISQGQIDAGRELRKARDLLGERGYRLVSLVAGEGFSLNEVAGNEKRARLVAADLLRMCLDDLSVLWRLATRRR